MGHRPRVRGPLPVLDRLAERVAAGADHRVPSGRHTAAVAELAALDARLADRPPTRHGIDAARLHLLLAPPDFCCPASVWSPQAVISMEPVTATAATAASRNVRDVRGFPAAVVQWVVLAVMVGFLRLRGSCQGSGTHLRVSRPRVVTASCHSD